MLHQLHIFWSCIVASILKDILLTICHERDDIVCSSVQCFKGVIEDLIAIFKAKGNQKKLIDGEKGVFDLQFFNCFY